MGNGNGESADSSSEVDGRLQVPATCKSFPAFTQDLLEKYVDHVVGVGVFEEDFHSGNLAEDDADTADTESVEALQACL